MPTFSLSCPPSVNAMFVNVKAREAIRARTGKPAQKRFGRGKAKRYRDWIAGELKSLIAQRARPVPGQVAIKLTFPERSKADLDSRIKASIDLIKRAGIIEDDGPAYVRSLTADFDAIEGMTISVEPYIRPERMAP